MPKTLLNVSQSTGNRPPVSLNTTHVMTAKNHNSGSHQNTSFGAGRQKNSIGVVPHTTKSVMVKPPIGSIASKRKSI